MLTEINILVFAYIYFYFIVHFYHQEVKNVPFIFLMPDTLGSVLNELPVLLTRKAILLGWAYTRVCIGDSVQLLHVYFSSYQSLCLNYIDV